MKTTKFITYAFALLVFGSFVSCASRPKLYPNEKLKTSGKAAGEEDINKCIKEADVYLDSSEGKKIVKSAGFGAVVGGAIGAVAGAFTGDIGAGAAQGAAMGGIGGAAGGALSPDEIKHRYVNKCLSDKGYSILGWD
ncbi:MAG: hypothetical protein Q7U04_03050 [Bacteriovorax sp.]|nr:hypothetical protein [Bacteriovorax sp.]